MQGNRGGRNDLFGFGHPFAGLGRPGGLISSLMGGRDPFDDPFFTHPFESMMGPSMMGPGMLGPSMFGPNMFGPGGSLFADHANVGLLEDQSQRPNESKGPIIQELSSDEEEGGGIGQSVMAKKDNPRKHSRSGKDPYVQDPDDEVEEKKSRHMQDSNQYGRAQPQNHTYCFQSSSVTYSGLNGPYYTSSTTRRSGGDGVTVEERKEADRTTGKATHRVSKGLRDKGHTVTRKLNSDGRVDKMQTLHNLNEDELTGFEEAWKGKARQHLPGWNPGLEMLDDCYNEGSGGISSRQNGMASRGWALPPAEEGHNSGRVRSHGHTQSSSFNGRA